MGVDPDAPPPHSRWGGCYLGGPRGRPQLRPCQAPSPHRRRQPFLKTHCHLATARCNLQHTGKASKKMLFYGGAGGAESIQTQAACPFGGVTGCYPWLREGQAQGGQRREEGEGGMGLAAAGLAGFGWKHSSVSHLTAN